jgi:hypothetical protein
MIEWNVLSDARFYLESVSRFFKFKMPGSKAAQYKIRLSGLHIADPQTRLMIEGIIWKTLGKLTPAYTENMAIVWDE